ncbi:MAG: response regulator [Acidobacteriaceae bacterium]|nr:response regulator [Acidobacteriaceae bacterium]
MNSIVGRPEVLIVEDEQVVALDLEQSLRQLGYTVSGVAHNRSDAVELAGSRTPDLILMDIRLSGGDDGIAAAEDIRRQWKIPVIFVTAHSDEETLQRAKLAGAFGYLTKPFRTNELNAAVAIALHQHRVARQWFAEHEWLSTMLASLGEGVIATDTHARVRYMNPVAESLTGWTQQQASGKRLEEVYPLLTATGEPVEKSPLRLALESREPMRREPFQLVSRSGSKISIEDVAAPIEDAHGNLTGAAAVFVNISERLRAWQERDRLVAELERSNAELTRFSYAVSHDLQSPLHTIRNFTDLLGRHLRDKIESDDVELLSNITQSADRMQALILSLLRYSQAGHGSIRREPVEPDAVVKTVEFSLALVIAEAHAEIRVENLPIIEADRIQMEQLFQNLIGNAIQYRRPGINPVISIRGEERAEGWFFAISDNGQGIPEKYVEIIFQPLKRLHGVDVPGTGLGLALCRTIVERHGGQIWVESPGDGKGSTFHVFIARENP